MVTLLYVAEFSVPLFSNGTAIFIKLCKGMV